MSTEEKNPETSSIDLNDPRALENLLIELTRLNSLEIEQLKNKVESLEQELKEARKREQRSGEIAAAVETAPSESPAQTEDGKKTSGKHIVKLIGDVVFYIVLVGIVATALLVRFGSNGAPTNIAGYSGMIVLTESMQREIPKGSLVITKTVDCATLEIGDDITYLANQTTTLTHRIVGIMENYMNTGERAFETQGVENAEPDKKPVPAANVVGKVVFHSEALGKIAGVVVTYWPILLLGVVVMYVLTYVLRLINAPDD